MVAEAARNYRAAAEAVRSARQGLPPAAPEGQVPHPRPRNQSRLLRRSVSRVPKTVPLGIARSPRPTPSTGTGTGTSSTRTWTPGKSAPSSMGTRRGCAGSQQMVPIDRGAPTVLMTGASPAATTTFSRPSFQMESSTPLSSRRAHRFGTEAFAVGGLMLRGQLPATKPPKLSAEISSAGWPPPGRTR